MTQRPIEFRAWDKKKEKMYPVATIGLGGNAIQLTADWQPLSSVILLQFTGLYDKNKRKIFEGHKVKQTDEHGNEETGIVSYEPSWAGYVLRWTTDTWVRLSPEYELEIVGEFYD